MDTLPDFLEPLATLNGPFPHEAVAAAIERREESVPHLLAALERASIHPGELLGDDAMLHEYALFLLAQFRETRGYPYAVAIARYPLVNDLLGDTVTESLGPILASLSGGDPTPIQSLAEDEQADDYARGAGIEALGAMSRHGLWPEPELASYLTGLYTVGLKREPSHVWDALIAVSADLAMREHLDLIREAFEEGLANPGFDSFKHVSGMIRSGGGDAHDMRAYRLIDNTVSEIGLWYCFDEPFKDKHGDGDDEKLPTPIIPSAFTPAPVEFSPTAWRPDRETFRRTEPKIGRNDPCSCGSGKKYKKCCGQP